QTREGGGGFPLGTGGDSEDRAPRQLARALGGPNEVAGPREVARLVGDAHVRSDAPPEEDDLALRGARDVAPEAQSMHVRGEDRDAHRAVRALYDGLEHVADPRFASRAALVEHVRRVAEQKRDPVSPDFLETRDVERLTVGRGVVEFEVPRMQDRPHLGTDGE